MTDRPKIDAAGIEEFRGKVEHRFNLADAAKFYAICDLALRGLEQQWVSVDPERLAQMIAHRACCGVEADNANGKIHGYCLVCGVPWPCEYAGPLPAPPTGGK